MRDTRHTLAVTKDELAVIEAALHTQSKILHVQAGAGGDDARARLNEVKRVISSVAGQKPADSPSRPRRSGGRGWFGMSRIFG
ncbi:hypothetical protein AB2B41_17870 [Marimonas sp. MJW-29]|uniref:Uncharacterized protein n=1 Tax=Sulfitobacter sediminis TaxID=3234186 RepID=A0ABV3RS39_9RHOB